MSIIYDALKKVEKSNSVTPGKVEDKKSPAAGSKLKAYLAAGVTVCLGAVIANFFFGALTNPVNKVKSAKTKKTGPALIVISPPVPPKARVNVPAPELSKAQTPPQPILQPKPDEAANVTAPSSSGNKPQSEFPPMVINGIFFSQSEGYALINNQIVKEGDTVSGALVKRIGLDEIEFEFEGSTKKISTK